jgi:hypothetical protein
LGVLLAEFVPFLEYGVEIMRVICTTNALESINARYRRAVRFRGHLKCLYLVTRALDPTGGLLASKAPVLAGIAVSGCHGSRAGGFCTRLTAHFKPAP